MASRRPPPPTAASSCRPAASRKQQAAAVRAALPWCSPVARHSASTPSHSTQAAELGHLGRDLSERKGPPAVGLHQVLGVQIGTAHTCTRHNSCFCNLELTSGNSFAMLPQEPKTAKPREHSDYHSLQSSGDGRGIGTTDTIRDMLAPANRRAVGQQPGPTSRWRTAAAGCRKQRRVRYTAANARASVLPADGSSGRSCRGGQL